MTVHFGHTDKEKVSLDFWLIIHPGDPKNWNRRPRVRVTAGTPALGRSERAMNLKMSLPISLFETPSISATINVAEPNQPVHIDASAIADAVRGIVGMDVDIQVNMPEERADG